MPKKINGEPRQIGRPPLVDQAQGHQLEVLLRVGLSIAGACRVVGITSAAYRDWRRKAEGGQEPYQSFIARCQKAIEEGKAKKLEEIERHGKKSWQAAAWLLERRFPEEFGRRVVIDLRALPEQTLERIAEGEAVDIAPSTLPPIGGGEG